jgi:hypothetical protein
VDRTIPQYSSVQLGNSSRRRLQNEIEHGHARTIRYDADALLRHSEEEVMVVGQKDSDRSTRVMRRARLRASCHIRVHTSHWVSPPVNCFVDVMQESRAMLGGLGQYRKRAM